MIRVRYANELVGLLVILALVLFLGVAFQAGVLSRWFQPTHVLRIILPEQGSAGLSPGGDVEMLGTKAGEVRRVVITPNQQMYAEADIEDQAQPFIRRDSVAVIRKRFGVAGAAYVDVSRGKGPALDWSFAVIQGVTERDPSNADAQSNLGLALQEAGDVPGATAAQHGGIKGYEFIGVAPGKNAKVAFEFAAYVTEKNAESIDGLPAL